MDPSNKVHQIVENTVSSLGFELIRVAFGGGRTQTLQIMAERPDGTMSVDDCAKLSRELSALLDVEDPISCEYLLEVSSPGIDRPLTRKKDFEKWAGFECKVELQQGDADGRRRFKGVLGGIDADEILLTTIEGDALRLSFDDLAKAKLMLTDELLKAASDGFKGYPAEREVGK